MSDNEATPIRTAILFDGTITPTTDTSQALPTLDPAPGAKATLEAAMAAGPTYLVSARGQTLVRAWLESHELPVPNCQANLPPYDNLIAPAQSGARNPAAAADPAPRGRRRGAPSSEGES